MMVDSSVLVAAFNDTHPHFLESFTFLDSLKSGAMATMHSMAETYTGITRLPIQPRPIPSNAKIYIDSLSSCIRWIPLDQACYHYALDLVVGLGMSGAKIYDAIIVATAYQAKVEAIYTWNLKDFIPLAQKAGIVVRTPHVL